MLPLTRQDLIEGIKNRVVVSAVDAEVLAAYFLDLHTLLIEYGKRVQETSRSPAGDTGNWSAREAVATGSGLATSA